MQFLRGTRKSVVLAFENSLRRHDVIDVTADDTRVCALRSGLSDIALEGVLVVR